MTKTQNSRSANRKSTNSGSFGGVMDMARERPIAAVAAAASAVAAAGVFLWSKRARISDQLTQLSDQIGEWTDTMVADRASPEVKTVGRGKATGTGTRSPTRRKRSTTASARRNANSSAAISASNGGSPVA